MASMRCSDCIESWNLGISAEDLLQLNNVFSTKGSVAGFVVVVHGEKTRLDNFFRVRFQIKGDENFLQVKVYPAKDLKVVCFRLWGLLLRLQMVFLAESVSYISKLGAVVVAVADAFA